MNNFSLNASKDINGKYNWMVKRILSKGFDRRQLTISKRTNECSGIDWESRDINLVNWRLQQYDWTWYYFHFECWFEVIEWENVDRRIAMNVSIQWLYIIVPMVYNFRIVVELEGIFPGRKTFHWDCSSRESLLRTKTTDWVFKTIHQTNEKWDERRKEKQMK